MIVAKDVALAEHTKFLTTQAKKGATYYHLEFVAKTIINFHTE